MAYAVDLTAKERYIPPMKNPQAQALGKLGGMARAKALTAEQRLAISMKANETKRKRALIRKGLGDETDCETLRPVAVTIRTRPQTKL